jgi:hypothetical protein
LARRYLINTRIANRVADPGCLSGIRKKTFPITDPRVENAADPGSATLISDSLRMTLTLNEGTLNL